MRRLPNFYSVVIPLFALTVLGISCSSNPDQANKEYVEEVNQWHAKRIAALEEKDGWMSLAGLYRLEEGSQTLGADSANKIVFPPQAPPQIGTITKNGNTISINANTDAQVMHKGTEVSEMELTSGNQDEATVLRHDALLWYVIQRRGDYYIRLKDTKHPNFKTFDGIERFPVSEKWKVKANFNAFEKPKSITVPDVLNEGMQDSLYGMLEFTIDGQNYSIAPLGHPQNDDEFFIIFGDQTNGESTYSGGRYIYIPTPNENGETYLDFNQAYNPPCVFTHFATCPLPPPQNRLDLKITAGEKMYGDSKAH